MTRVRGARHDRRCTSYQATKAKAYLEIRTSTDGRRQDPACSFLQGDVKQRRAHECVDQTETSCPYSNLHFHCIHAAEAILRGRISRPDAGGADETHFAGAFVLAYPATRDARKIHLVHAFHLVIQTDRHHAQHAWIRASPPLALRQSTSTQVVESAVAVSGAWQ